MKGATTIGAVIRAWAETGRPKWEWSSSQLMIGASAPVANRSWVTSDCQVSFGMSAAKHR
jgi:hypothetical protein